MRGAERIPGEGAVILVANHESMLDPWLLPLATSRPVRYMAKAELWRYPVVRWVMDKFGTFPIERGTGDGGAVGRAAQLLDEGELLGIFPQGTCLPFPDRRWYRGAAKLAIATGATIVPTCLVGTERALRPGKFKIGFPRVLVLVGEPIEVERGKPNLAAAKALTERIEACDRRAARAVRPTGPRLVSAARAGSEPGRPVEPRRSVGPAGVGAVRCGERTTERWTRMSPTKKRQTMGKMTRERELRERRALKQEKKDGRSWLPRRTRRRCRTAPPITA